MKQIKNISLGKAMISEPWKTENPEDIVEVWMDYRNLEYICKLIQESASEKARELRERLGGFEE